MGKEDVQKKNEDVKKMIRLPTFKDLGTLSLLVHRDVSLDVEFSKVKKDEATFLAECSQLIEPAFCRGVKKFHNMVVLTISSKDSLIDEAKQSLIEDGLKLKTLGDFGTAK